MRSFDFEGKDIEFENGDSIAAALIRAGIWDFRQSRNDGEPRSLFCGIGHCYDCLVVVDGVTNQRACLVRSTESLSVRRQRGVQ
jgi:aerobic-type carbon monoxide dehydrogenase small subunit (CoxS/CutS family)